MTMQFLRAAAVCSAAILLSACSSGDSSSGEMQQRWSITANAGTGGSASPTSQDVIQGQIATITFTPAAGYDIAAASGCGGALNGNTYTTAPAITHCTVTATFARKQWTITTTAGANGSATPLSQEIGDGERAAITITPDSGFDIDTVSGCDGTLNGNTYTTAPATANCTVAASFMLKRWTIIPGAGAGGAISPATPQQVQHGGGASFTVTPASGFDIGAVTGCGGTLNGNTYTIAAASANCAVTASFTPKLWTVIASAGANGSAAPTSQVVSNGQNASITFTPNVGYALDSASGCGGTLAGNVFTTGAVLANCTVTASFTAVHTVTASAGAGGNISPASQSVADGDTAVVTLTANAGYILDSVTGCGITLDAGSWTTAAVTANCAISATFRAASSVFAGQSHSCSLLDEDGAVVNQCWGQNNAGQLGSASMLLVALGDEPGESPRLLPPIDLVDPGLSILSMGLGNQHSCAVLSDRQLYCWGSNAMGQLGIGPGANTHAMNTPVDFGGTPAVEVNAGLHTCARLVDGTVYCWGYNTSGQLGNGGFANTSLPGATVTLADRAMQIDTGAAHTCARLANNTVWCWGDNSSGQLGDSDGGNDSATPAQVNLGVVTVTDIAAGGLFSCVIASGQVKCWGENGGGQLGNNDGTNTDLDVPSAALNLNGETPVDVEVGGEHACVLTASGKVLCWGESDAGQTGQNDTTDDIVPVEVNFGAAYTAAAIATGGDHTCAVLKPTNPLDTTRPVRCWGEGGVGQLGLEGTDDIGDNEGVDNPAFNIDI